MNTSNDNNVIEFRGSACKPPHSVQGNGYGGPTAFESNSAPPVHTISDLICEMAAMTAELDYRLATGDYVTQDELRAMRGIARHIGFIEQDRKGN